MNFKEFAEVINTHFQDMCTRYTQFYTVNTDADELYEHYLNSYPEGTNGIYRVRRDKDCSACRHFIKRMGNVVAINGGELETIWDVQAEGEFAPVVEAMQKYIRQYKVSDFFLTADARIGVIRNFDDKDTSNGVVTFYHLHADIPAAKRLRSAADIGSIRSEMTAVKDVFKRSLDEISLDAVNTVLELITQNSLYRGSEWLNAIQTFKQCMLEYRSLDDAQKELYAWSAASRVGGAVGKIRNHSIGVLLQDISADVDLDTAVSRYEAIVAPTNYKRPKPIFSKRMLEDAKQKITELGYMDSLSRRFATLDDITVNNILFSNKDASRRIQGADDVFSALESKVAVNPKSFSKVEEISIDSFISDVLPSVTEIEAFVENKHRKNFVSLIAPKVKEAPSMFKWTNNFSWAYSGNLADSDIRQNVKAAGGDVNGVLRFSIQWNEASDCKDDLDAHCFTPKGSHIFFGRKQGHPSLGELDVDIINPQGVAVENITFPKISLLERGTYQFAVHCYSDRGGRSGFKAEIEFDGQIFRFNYPQPLRQDQKVEVAEVEFDGREFKLVEKLKSSPYDYSQKIWNVDTCKLTPVTVMCYSPNYWDDQAGIGNKHYMFMLKDCISEDTPNGFYNEYLNNNLSPHRKVFEALGTQCKAEYAEDQLSGIGFSSTVRSDLLVKVKGNTERMLRIKF